MARGISFAFLIVAAACAGAACVGEDPDSVPTTPAADAGTPTGGGGDNLLGTNGGFENGCGLPFFSSNADLTSETSTVNTGGKSCKVCRRADAAEAGYSIFAYVDEEPKAGDVFTVSAQMRRVQGAEPGQDGLISIIQMDSTGSPIEGTGDSKNTPAIVDEWKPGSVTWTVPQGAPSSQRVRVQLGLAASDSGNCFLVDDFVVTKQK